uniref:hypothetical protein n=1 Tax=Cronobacter sakazakii TaxID=28141 RepID=UPI001C37D3B4
MRPLAQDRRLWRHTVALAAEFLNELLDGAFPVHFEPGHYLQLGYHDESPLNTSRGLSLPKQLAGWN